MVDARSEEVRIEHPHLGDAIDRQGGGLRSDADRLGLRRVDNAEAAATVRRDERVDPGHAFAGIGADHFVAVIRGAAVSGRAVASTGAEGAFDEIAWHGRLQFARRCAHTRTRSPRAIRSNYPDLKQARCAAAVTAGGDFSPMSGSRLAGVRPSAFADPASAEDRSSEMLGIH